MCRVGWLTDCEHTFNPSFPQRRILQNARIWYKQGVEEQGCRTKYSITWGFLGGGERAYDGCKLVIGAAATPGGR